MNGDLTIRFLIAINEKLYKEEEIIEHLDSLRRQVKRKSTVSLEGIISILYYGQELLGITYKEELNHVHLQVQDLYDASKLHVEAYFPMNGARLRLIAEKRYILYEFVSRKHHPEPFSIKVLLPANEFIREWLLMQCRMRQLEAEFGRVSTLDKSYFEHFEPEIRDLIGAEKIEWLITASLHEILQNQA
jgi:hypothetical protein